MRQPAVRDSIPWVRDSLLHRRKLKRYVFAGQDSSRKSAKPQKRAHPRFTDLSGETCAVSALRLDTDNKKHVVLHLNKPQIDE